MANRGRLPRAESGVLDAAPMATLYIENLDYETTERDLVVVFSSVSPVRSVSICSSTRRSIRFGYINFFSVSDAYAALTRLKGKVVKGKQLRLMWWGTGTLLVKEVGSFRVANLKKTFSKHGEVTDLKIFEEFEVGVVQYSSLDSCSEAFNKLNGVEIKGKQLSLNELSYSNIFVQNMGDDVTEDLLRVYFSSYGKILGVSIVKDDSGKSEGFGFIQFQCRQDARKATKIYRIELGSEESTVTRTCHPADGKTVFMSHLPLDFNEAVVREILNFAGKIMKISMKSKPGEIGALVRFSTHSEAKSALTMNGCDFGGGPTQVEFAREDYEDPFP